MNRQNLAKFCKLLALALLAGFAVKTVVDYIGYTTTLNSAPFSVYVLVNAVYFLIPAAVALGIGCWLGRKGK